MPLMLKASQANNATCQTGTSTVWVDSISNQTHNLLSDSSLLNLNRAPTERERERMIVYESIF